MRIAWQMEGERTVYLLAEVPQLSAVSAHETDLADREREDFWFILALEGAKMRQKSGPAKEPAEQVIKNIRRATRRQF